MALNSELPKEIGDLAQDGDMRQVCAWLDAGGSIDAQDEAGYTLIACCALGNRDDRVTGDEQVALARHLIGRGANVNIDLGDESSAIGCRGNAPLHFACSDIAPGRSAMVSLLLAAGANVNARNYDDETPLSVAVSLEDSYPEQAEDNWLEIVTLLLKRGASLDCRSGRSALGVFNLARGHWAEDENVRAVKALLHGVRQHGSYNRYIRAPHRAVLACHSLAMRGYLAPKGMRRDVRRTRGAQKWKAAVAFLAKQGDNGIVWTVLSYWRATT